MKVDVLTAAQAKREIEAGAGAQDVLAALLGLGRQQARRRNRRTGWRGVAAQLAAEALRELELRRQVQARVERAAAAEWDAYEPEVAFVLIDGELTTTF